MLKDRTQEYFQRLQDEICKKLEEIDGKEKFLEDKWERYGGGGGRTRVIQNGKIFEKGGVNFSAVWGEISEKLTEKMNIKSKNFFATGISLVIHPFNPMIPTTHMNLRYFETSENESWFGGGIDLTPYYPFKEDVIFFHKKLKEICDKHNKEYYPKFKKWCDEYFFIKHRNETRGVGGIFFDYARKDMENFFLFVQDIGKTFLNTYPEIVEKRKNEPFTEKEKEFQLIRRGRYVEFNLIYDRGTLFGLETQGRTESILMSLPPTVKWIYDYKPEPDSREAKLWEFLKPQEWV